MKIILRYCLALLFIGLNLVSCTKDNDLAEDINRSVLIYMGANNNLSQNAIDNINSMEQALLQTKADIIVYVNLPNQPPRIFKIQPDNSPEIKSQVLKTYGDHNSADPAVMKDILQTMQQFARGRSQGLILWSHASNWLPDGNNKPSTRSFNDDNGRKTNVKELAAILPSALDFLIFDACNMASVEVLYELRNKAKYAIASPSEILTTGMPYELIINDLTNDNLEAGLRETAKKYFNFYNDKTGPYQSASISLIDNRLWNSFLNETKLLTLQNSNLQVDLQELQRLEFDPYSITVSYDFLDFMRRQYGDVRSLQNAMDKLILYKAHTPYFLNKPIHTFSGLSCYLPTSQTAWAHGFFRELDWAKDSGFTNFILD